MSLLLLLVSPTVIPPDPGPPLTGGGSVPRFYPAQPPRAVFLDDDLLLL